jgi:hypothetical protein
MHAVAHAQENKAETTLPPPGTGEMCELRPYGLLVTESRFGWITIDMLGYDTYFGN